MQQRREGAEPVVMLGSHLIQLTQRNDRRRRHLRASTPKLEIEAVPSAMARLNGSKEGLRTLGGRDRIAHELGQARNRERATESWKRTQGEEGRAEGGRAVFMVVEKTARPVRAQPSPIRRPLNSGGKALAAEFSRFGRCFPQPRPLANLPIVLNTKPHFWPPKFVQVAGIL